MKQFFKKAFYLFCGLLFLQPILELFHFLILKLMFIGLGASTSLSGEGNVISNFIDEHSAQNTYIFFDVGANIGQYSTMLYQKLNSRRANFVIYSFEPGKFTYSQFLKNTSNFKNLHPYNIALGSVISNQELFSDFAGSGLASLYKRDLKYYNNELRSEGVVEVKTLDSFCMEHQIEKIDFLKLDVEGSELNVLKGAKNMLANGKIGWIQFEFGGTALDARICLKDFFNLLPDYDFYRVVKTGLRKIKQYDERWEIFLTSNFVAKPKKHV